jgi:hypothetical protein
MAGTTTTGRLNTTPGSSEHDVAVQFNKLVLDHNSVCLMAPAPVIKAGGGVLAKTGATATIAIVGGVMINIAASTDLGALTGINITAANFRIVLWGADAAGATTAFAGTEGTTLALATMPTVTAGQTVVAGAYITHSGAFTGNTTALDTATTVYFSTVGIQYAALAAARIGNGNGGILTV